MASSQTPPPGPARARTEQFYFAVWRWHFYAGLFVVPFLLMLAVTGLMMMFITQFQGRDGETIAIPPGNTELSLAEQSAAVLAAQPGTITEWIGPKAPGLTAVFRVKTDDGQRLVAVNQYTGEVLESWDRRAGWYDLAENIHSTLLMGDTGDRLIEIAAGLGILLVLSGLYLWWPRGTGLGALVPDLRARGRALWKSLHGVTGFWISACLVLFLVSGLAWTGIWGGRLVQAWSSFPAGKWDNVPLSDDIHASMNHGSINDVPWALEQTPMPASGSAAGAAGVPAGTPVDAGSVIALGRALGIEGRFRLAYPAGESGVWTISRDSMSGDSDDPFSDRTVHVDRHSGRILADVRFADYSWAGKAMALGIPFHMGLMGGWNFVLNAVFCLAVIFVCASGVVMWLIRRPSRAARLAAPPRPRNLPLWQAPALIALVVSLAFPLTALALLAVLILDLLLLASVPRLRRAVS